MRISAKLDAKITNFVLYKPESRNESVFRRLRRLLPLRYFCNQFSVMESRLLIEGQGPLDHVRPIAKLTDSLPDAGANLSYII